MSAVLAEPREKTRRALDVALIEKRMAEQGLSPSDVARHLRVSREAVSGWLSGEYLPRASKALRLCMLLKLRYHEFYGLPAPTPEDEPIQVAYVGRSGRVAKQDQDRLEMKLGTLPCIEYFIPPVPVFAAAVVTAPEFSKQHLDEVAASARAVAGVRPGQPVNLSHLLKLLKDVRACVFPSRMGRRAPDTWTTVTRLRRTQRLVVHFSVVADERSQLRGLAEAYGVCLSWHALPLEDARRYGREVAERLLSPESAYDVALNAPTDLAFYETTQALGLTELTDGLAAFQDGCRNAAKVGECLLMDLMDGWAFSGMLIPSQRDRRRAELQAEERVSELLASLPAEVRVLETPDPTLACALVTTFGPSRPQEYLEALELKLAQLKVSGTVLFDLLFCNGAGSRRFFTISFNGTRFAQPLRFDRLETLPEPVRAAIQARYTACRNELDTALLNPAARDALDNNITL
jgi:transcriptional regulator with XRE-family HTH domain